MPVGSAISAILSIFLAYWFFIMTRDPKEWRLWWMNIAGLPDLNSTREDRRRDEFWIKCLSFTLSLGCLVLTLYCIYFTIEGVKEAKRPRTQFEQNQERTKKEIQQEKSPT